MTMTLEISDLDLPSIKLEQRRRFTQHHPTHTLICAVEREDTPSGTLRQNGSVHAYLDKGGVHAEWKESNLGEFYDAFKKVVTEGGSAETDDYTINRSEESRAITIAHKVKMLGKAEFSIGMSIHVANEILDTFNEWIEEFEYS